MENRCDFDKKESQNQQEMQAAAQQASQAQLDGLICDPPKTDVLITGQSFYSCAPGISVLLLEALLCEG